MHCGECGAPMTRRPDGAWNACCNRLGYWYDQPPLPTDMWVVGSGQYMHGRLIFYPTGKWPLGKAPTPPHQ